MGERQDVSDPTAEDLDKQALTAQAEQDIENDDEENCGEAYEKSREHG